MDINKKDKLQQAIDKFLSSIDQSKDRKISVRIDKLKEYFNSDEDYNLWLKENGFYLEAGEGVFGDVLVAPADYKIGDIEYIK